MSLKEQQTSVKLTFYVAGDGIFSRNAIANLNNLVASINENPGISSEIIDVTQTPSTALEQGIFTTPTLVISSGKQNYRFVGDLSDPEKIIEVLKSEGH